MNEIYKLGQQAFEQGLSFIEDNPYRVEDQRHFDWAKGWFARRDYYQALSYNLYLKEQEAEDARVIAEQEKRLEQEEIKKYKNSKKGKLEAAGQSTLF